MCEAAGEADQLLEAELLGPAHEVGAELPRAARHEAGPVNTKVKSATTNRDISSTVLYCTENTLDLDIICRGGAAKFGFISITYHKYILGVYKYILRLEISTFDCEKR